MTPSNKEARQFLKSLDRDKKQAIKADKTTSIATKQAARDALKADMDAKQAARDAIAPRSITPAPKPMPMPAPDIKADMDAKQAARDAIAPQPKTPAARPTTPAPTVGNVRNYIQNRLSGSGSSDGALKNAIDAASTKFNQPAPSAAPPANPMNVGLGDASSLGLGTAMSTPAGPRIAAGNMAMKNMAMKRGGSVRNKPSAKFSSGGSTSKASSRGDGIAQRGKTKGRYI